jgi:FkbM family methyltransferase
VLPELVRLYIRSNARGSTRGTFFLAHRLKSLQAVPVTINQTQQLFVDLRDGLSHTLLAGSPWDGVPWEVDEQIVMRRLIRSGDVALDIGAHIGLHMVLLSELVGRDGAVHAFEANPVKLPALSVTASRLNNTVIHPHGLSDVARRAVLFVPEDQSMASLSDWTEGRVGAVRQVECELKRLDDLVAEGSVASPDFIKCDVEGAELQVLTGAARTLNRPDGPIILFEANAKSARSFGSSISAATDFLRTLNEPQYSIFHVQADGQLVRIEALSGDCDHFNLVAIPSRRAHRMTAV